MMKSIDFPNQYEFSQVLIRESLDNSLLCVYTPFMSSRLAKKGPKIDFCMCSTLRQTSRVLTQYYDKALKPSGVKATQFPILAAVANYAPVTISELAEVLVIDRTTLARNLAVLEKHGWLTVEPGEDKRSRELQLTELGGEKLKAAIKYWYEAQDEVELQMGEREFDLLLKKLSKTTELMVK
jgi:DNA-binding MarR family transcriptional regulator